MLSQVHSLFLTKPEKLMESFPISTKPFENFEKVGPAKLLDIVSMDEVCSLFKKDNLQFGQKKGSIKNGNEYIYTGQLNSKGKREGIGRLVYSDGTICEGYQNSEQIGFLRVF